MEKCDIVIIGCGGTGSHYIKELGRFLYSNKKLVLGDIRIVLADGDIVEEKNLERQAFLGEDIGENKAEIMSGILQQVFGLECQYVDKYIDEVSDLRKLIRNDSIVVLVGCVDNHQCRQSMHEFYNELSHCVYMDSANEYAVGEVIIGSRIGGVEVYPDRAFYFPDILSSEEIRRSDESCEVLNQSQPQHLITNQYAAMILLTNTVRLLAMGEWIGGIYYFDSFKCFVQDRTMK